MSSFIETTEQVTSETHDINKKILSQLKTYTFFIFYDLLEKDRKSHTILEKMSFSLKDEKQQPSQQEVSNNIIKTRQVSLNFYNLNNQNDILHGISDVRSHSFQNKAKLIISANEQKLVDLIKQFETMKVDITSFPLIINSPMFQSDLNAFLGWKSDNNMSVMTIKNLPSFQLCSQEWIKSSTEKIDLWQAQIIVSKDNGVISKLVNNKLVALPYDKKQMKQLFMSHFCIGHHASLLMKCQQKMTTNQNSIGNNFISFMQSFRKFCCIGDKNMKSTTGIVNITLIDEKGQQMQIMKNLRNGDSMEQQSNMDLKSAKYKQYKDVVSILLANINVYQNAYLQNSGQGKINDSKIQLLTFDSLKSHRKICSAQGQIRLKLQTPSIDVQIGQSFYRLENPLQIKISLFRKMKVGFHHKMVKC